jgi:dipeptidyl aminopeptidase/acylaminoacyl peptidase
MTVHDDLDRLLSRWLDETAGAGAPDYLDEALSGIASIRQRPAWLSPGRWLPMQLTMPRVAVPRFLPILIVLALLAVALFIAVILVGNQQRLPPPFGLARTGLLVFDSNDDLYVASTDGSAARVLVSGPGVQAGATWSRDGTHVAYLVDDHSGVAELRVAAADGSSAITVVSGLAVPDLLRPAASWSPDGVRLAFTTGAGELWVVDADGREPHRLGQGTMLRFDPAWSPDGSLIAFRGQATFDMDAPRRVYVIRPDGKDERPVSRESNGINAMMGPNWSGDGRLLYDAVYDKPRGVDGGDIVVATNGPGGWIEATIVGGEPIDWLARWSNDGTRVAFLRSRSPMSEGDVIVVDADGSNVRGVSDRLMSTAGPCWTPDDTAIGALTGKVGEPINGQSGATYLVIDVADGGVLATIPAPGINGILECSWQRLAP